MYDVIEVEERFEASVNAPSTYYPVENEEDGGNEADGTLFLRDGIERFTVRPYSGHVLGMRHRI